MSKQNDACHRELRPQYYCPECGAYNPEEED